MGVAASCEHRALFLQVSQVLPGSQDLWFTLPVLGAVILHLLVDWLFPSLAHASNFGPSHLSRFMALGKKALRTRLWHLRFLFFNDSEFAPCLFSFFPSLVDQEATQCSELSPSGSETSEGHSASCPHFAFPAFPPLASSPPRHLAHWLVSLLGPLVTQGCGVLFLWSW